MAVDIRQERGRKMAKMANILKELDRAAGEAYRKGRISFQVCRFEEALAAYG